jgi:hypothetical protein
LPQRQVEACGGDGADPVEVVVLLVREVADAEPERQVPGLAGRLAAIEHEQRVRAEVPERARAEVVGDRLRIGGDQADAEGDLPLLDRT